MKPIMPELKIAARAAGNARGQAVLEQILRAALRVLVDHGMDAFTMRKIAAAAGIPLGNLSYYFKSKQELLEALIDAMASGYEDAAHQLISGSNRNPERKLRDLISWTMKDLSSRKAKRLLPQLRDFANFKEMIERRVENLYIKEQKLMTGLIKQINPAIKEVEARDIAVFITATMEGFASLVGNGRPLSDRLVPMEELVVKSFIALIRS
jgi:AcrR family transcriptional regulator